MSAVSHAAYLPAVRRPPHDPRQLPINPSVGWHIAIRSDVVDDACRALVLASEPSSDRSLAEDSGSLGGLKLPSNVASAQACGLLLLDRVTARLKRFDPCTCSFIEIPHTGGAGAGARQFEDPRAIAIGGGNVFVADTGKKRLAVFSLLGYLLRGEWRPPRGVSSQPWQPVGVTISSDCKVLVADPANGSIHVFNFSGRWLTEIPNVGAVSHIAIGALDTLYVVRDAMNPVSSYRLPDSRHPHGQLIAADLAYADVAPNIPWLETPVGSQGEMDLGPFCAHYQPSGDHRSRWFNLRGGVIAPPKPVKIRFKRQGMFITEALDSALYRCQWDRIVVEARVPSSAKIRIETFTAESALADSQVAMLSDDQWLTGQTVVPESESDKEWDCMVRSQPGRFLWLRVTLYGDGIETPSISGLRLDFPRISLRRYLPSVFGEEAHSADFTDRFLAVFDRGFRQIEDNIDNFARFLDPMSAPAESRGGDFLSWLGSWIGVTLDRQLPLAVRRKLVRHSGRLFASIGTEDGLRQTLNLYLGLDERRCSSRPSCGPCTTEPPHEWKPPALVLEHFRLRRWLYVGAGRLGDQAMLWGQRIVNRSQLSGPQTNGNAQLGVTQLDTRQDPLHDPFHYYAHKFSVFLPAWVSRLEGYRRTVDRVVAASKPAHAEHQLIYVEPRFRVGIQSMIGIDSVIGCYPQGVVVEKTRLGKASVLSEPELAASTLRVGRSSTIGFNARLR